MPSSSPHLRPSIIYSFCQAICRIVTTLMFDLKVSGIEHVPRTGGVLLLANHQSYLDPVVIGVQLRRPLSFLAKNGLFDVPVFGLLIRNLNAFPIRQGAGDVGALRETIHRLKEGNILTIFPEGTRTPNGEMAPLQPGFALIVRKADVPIVPVAIEGSFHAWRMGTPICRPQPIRVKFGPPIDVRGLKPAEIVTRVDQTLRELITELRAGDPP